MKKAFVMGLAAGALVALSAVQARAAVSIAGDFQGWDPGSTAMIDNGNGSYSYSVTGLSPGSRHEFKITDGTWNNTWPGANSWLVADGSGNASVTYWPGSAGDGWGPDTNRIGVSDGTPSWTAVGSWQHFDAGGSDWSNGDVFSVMSAIGGGIYKYSIAIPSAGTYEFKAVDSGSWDALGTDSRSINASTWFFTTTDPGQVVDMYADPGHGDVRVVVNDVPEPATLGLASIAGVALLARRRRA